MPPDSWSRGHRFREDRPERLSRGLIAGIQNPQLRGTALALIGAGFPTALMASCAVAALEAISTALGKLLMQAGSAIVLMMTAVLASGSWSGKTVSVCSSGHTGSFSIPVASSA